MAIVDTSSNFLIFLSNVILLSKFFIYCKSYSPLYYSPSSDLVKLDLEDDLLLTFSQYSWSENTHALLFKQTIAEVDLPMKSDISLEYMPYLFHIHL